MLNLELSYFSFKNHGGFISIKVQCLFGIFNIAVIILVVLKTSILIFHFLESMTAMLSLYLFPNPLLQTA